MQPLERQVISAVGRLPAVRNIELTGSRAEGRANEYSDWDFLVTTDDFPDVFATLADACAPLDPVAQQWDRLSPHQCFMLILGGPTKVDLLFLDEPHELEPSWIPTQESLAAIDRHFWDWALWLRSKQEAGKADLVAVELAKLFEHLLGPLGAASMPGSVAEAVAAYRDVRAAAERRFGCEVPRELEAAVAASVLA